MVRVLAQAHNPLHYKAYLLRFLDVFPVETETKPVKETIQIQAKGIFDGPSDAT